MTGLQVEVDMLKRGCFVALGERLGASIKLQWAGYRTAQASLLAKSIPSHTTVVYGYWVILVPGSS